MICDEYVDVPMNEFWMPDTSPRSPRLKLVASAATLYGRSIVAAESFTAKPEDGKWMAAPAQLKAPGDGAWTAGMNRFILHHYVHQPTDDGPGFGLGRYGTHFGRLNTWWPLATAWVSYVSRSQFLLQQGRPVADVCFLQNQDHGYGFPTGMIQVPVGYDFEICYPRHLQQMTWHDGVFALPGGPTYRLLALPDNWVADLPTLRHLRELVKAGAPIIGAAPVAPAGVSDYEAGAEFAALVAELWSPEALGRAAIRHVPIADALQACSLAPDVTWPTVTGDYDLHYTHRRTADADIYFVFNHSARPLAGEVTFRVSGRQPELWDSVTGTRTDARVFHADPNGTALPLALEPNGSKFILFRRPLPARWIESTTPENLVMQTDRLLAPDGQPVTLRYSDGTSVTRPAAAATSDTVVTGPWRVSFNDGRGAPAETTFPMLASWTENSDPGIKFYSGIATYHAAFDLPTDSLRAGVVAILDLGTVDDLAEVRLNGAVICTLWQPPFRTEVTGQLRAGANTLEVRVANRWVNRIIGDESIPTDLTYQATGTNKFTDGRLQQLPAWLYDRSKIGEKKRYSFTTWKHYDANSPLLPAGLLGPVRIEWCRSLSIP
jgi:hypothetical protein